MLLAVVLGLMLGIAGRTLLLQWATGVLAERRAAPTLAIAEFPRLAPPARRTPARPVRMAPRAPRPLAVPVSLPLRRAA